MLKRSSLAGALTLALVTDAVAQSYHDSGSTTVPGVVPLVGCSALGNCAGPVSSTNPMPVSGSFSATLSGFAPGGAYGAPLSVTTASSRVSLPAGTAIVVYNTGTSAAFVQLGGSSVVATTVADVIQPNSWMAFAVGSNTYLAAITASGTATLNISGGSGLPTGAGGGGGGGGSTPTGSAGSPNASVVTVQGISGGTNVPVSLSSLPALATGSNTIGAVTQASGPWTVNQTQLGSATLGGATGWGVAPTGNVAGVNANVLALPSLPAGSNTIGSISNSSFAISGTLPAFASTPTFNLGTLNGAATAANQTSVESSAGTSASSAITIQGSASGVAVPVTGSVAVVGYDSGIVRATATPASSAHSAGQSIGGLFSVPIARVNGGSGIVSGIHVWTSWGSTATYVLRLWQKNPANTTCTDGSSFSGSAIDDANLIVGPTALQFNAPLNTTGDSKTYADLTALSLDYKNADGTTTQNLYACLVTNSSDSPGSSATLSVGLAGPQN
jgi:hypothetical protein